MVLKIEARSLLWGLAIGMAAALGLGAVSKPYKVRPYQLCMAANEKYVFYARMHTGTGQVETWKYFMSRVPSQSDEEILLKPDIESPCDPGKSY